MMSRPKAASKRVSNETRTQKYFLSNNNPFPSLIKEVKGVVALEGRLTGGIVVNVGVGYLLPV